MCEIIASQNVGNAANFQTTRQKVVDGMHFLNHILATLAVGVILTTVGCVGP